MNRIRLLAEQVANQIAAGEVVERPASVVKELVENALDAQSSRLTVEIQAGGRSLIRVIDDGIGMSRDDALLCLERHATSKIQRAEDLTQISTMGFRGEALPSIASVSRMTLTSCERGSNLAATQLIIHGGKLLAVKEAGSPPGTTVEVRQLFYNLPARRKFLRKEETESAHIQHYLTLAALAYPEVALTFIREGRVVWQLPGLPTENGPAGRLAALKERMRALFGNTEKLLPVDVAAEFCDSDTTEAENDPNDAQPLQYKIRLWGLLGKPGVSRATRQDQHLFVNRRPVENRTLNAALIEGYHTALMKGQYPVCCLFLEIDPRFVDVNIHPTKREVKFRNDRVVRQQVTNAVRQTLLACHSSTAVPVPEKSAPKPGSIIQPEPQKSEQEHVEAESDPITSTKTFPQFTQLTGTPLSAWPKREEAPSLSLPHAAGEERGRGAPTEPGPTPVARSSALPAIAGTAGPDPLLKVPLRLLGVIGKLYVVLESDRGLVLMDQHAAHERILYEQMLNRMEQGSAPSQRLLLPDTVELSIRDAQFIRELLPTLNRLGVGLSEFGERTFLLDALPPFVKASDPRRFVLELVDELKAAGQEVNSMRLGEQTIAKTVCRHAVKANDPLSDPELENLVNDLRQCAMPYTCPHGRPTLIELNYRELEKKFGRTA